MAVQAYALSKQNRSLDAGRLFFEAKKLDQTLSKLGTTWRQGNIPWPTGTSQ
jgi:hypothetical protein